MTVDFWTLYLLILTICSFGWLAVDLYREVFR